MASRKADVIIFYDIPSTVPGSAWSPNTWKTRLALNIKRLAYRTQWVEYPDIAQLLTAAGAAPTEPGTITPYTLPAIFDPQTQTFVAESARIAAYLDEAYPDTPQIFPRELAAFQAAFQYAFLSTVQVAMLPIMLPRTLAVLNAPSAAYFRRTREQIFDCTIEELALRGDWERLKAALGFVAGWLDDRLLFRGGTGEVEPQHWVVTHADLSVAGWLIWMKIVLGPESEEWRTMEGWHGGRWKEFTKVFEGIMSVDT